MTASSSTRQPRVFPVDDPALVFDVEGPQPDAAAAGRKPTPEGKERRPQTPTGAGSARGIRWGAIFLSAVAGLAALSFGLWLTGFVAASLMREDWVGWTALGLLAMAGVAAAVLIAREIVGLVRLRRLGRVRADAEAALRGKDLARERLAVRRLLDLLAIRPELAWPLARFREHERDIRDPSDLLRLAERELLEPLDREARRAVLGSAKRVGMVTALSPTAVLSVSYVLIENLRMVRALATVYGGRPGFAGSLRLARLVLGHIAATGGIALTEDLLGQFLGQDLLRRLSRRLGEGAFNGALTARVGTAAVHVCRPLPFLDASPLRARDVVGELFRRKQQ